jgi:hypothetical protein
MKKTLIVTVCFCAVLGLVIVGCGQKKAAVSQEAITTAKSMSSVDQQGKYLEQQAQAFLNSKNYKEALNTAQYLLREVNSESKKAQDVLEKAKAEMQSTLKEKFNALTKK